MSFETWMAFVLGAVLSWGVYVPVLHEGQAAMGGGSPSAGAVRAFLCVGIAYFITAVLIPLIALQFGLADGEPLSFKDKDGLLNTRALTFSTLGGIAGAAGALCIIFSIKNGGSPMYVAPLVFAGAPIVNVIVSLSWHPDKVKSFSEAQSGWMMFIGGILLAAVGAGLVLYSKGYIEIKKAAVKKPQEAIVAQATIAPSPPV
jgi:uncharacterized membrane protein